MYAGAQPPVTRSDDGTPRDIAALERADQLAAACEADLERAQGNVFHAGSIAPKMAASRSLSPQDRHN
jgi:hypothetical protein